MTENKHYKYLPRCPLTVIFLDNHVISNIAKWKTGRELDEVTLDRTKVLYELIYKLVNEKKILCPELPTSQDEYRLDTRIEQTCEKVVIGLSQGVRFRHPIGIEDIQTKLAMKAYVQDTGPVDHPKEWLQMYINDPIQQLLTDTGFVYRFNWAKNIEDNVRKRERKEALKLKLEEIKKIDSTRIPTFDEKLDEEYEGYLRAIRRLAFKPFRKLQKGEAVSLEDGMGSMILAMHLIWWDRLGGKPEGIEGLIYFYQSAYLKSVPSVEIKCKLWAALAVYLKCAKPKESDAKDIEMIAAVMPYADLLVLDKTMTDLVRDRLHLGEKYNIQIFKLSESNALLGVLKQIEEKQSPLNNINLSNDQH